MISPFISPADVPDGSVLVDVRWTTAGSDRDGFVAGHVPGAHYLDLEDVLSGEGGAVVGRHPLPSPEAFAAGLGAAGIPDDAVVVAYDAAGSAPASRLVWMLRAIGQEATVLDGGLGAWTGPLESGDPPVEAVTRRVVEWPDGATADADEVATAAAAGLVVDSRSAERYRGEQTPLDPRPGHVPGARSLPYSDNIGADGRLAPVADLLARFERVDAGAATIFYCGSGVTACVNLLAAEQAGRGRGRLYVGSWSGWASDPSRPIARC